MNTELLKFIQHLSKEDKKTLSQKALKTTEECGELAKAVLPYDSAFATNHRFVQKEQILEECVDTVLCALSVAYHLDFNDDQIEDMMSKKSNKWLSLQQNEKDLKYPVPFEIHITVENTIPLDNFKLICEEIKVKPLLFDLYTPIPSFQLMTGSKHFGTNASVYEEACRINAALILKGLKIVRTKIESIIQHPKSPKKFTDPMPPGCYFETHFPIIIKEGDTLKINTELKEIKNLYDITLYSSSNILNNKQETVILTYRNNNTYLKNFEYDVEVITNFLNDNFDMKKHHSEFSVYDTNIEYDNEWMKNS